MECNIMPINLQEHEKLVLQIVYEFLNKNREFNIQKVIPFIHSRIRHTSINLNYQGIYEVLNSLLKKKILVEGSKLSRNDILKNKTRKLIYNFIQENPGTHFSKITKELNLSNHVVVWHLSMLLKFKFIKKNSIDNNEVFFDIDMNQLDVELIYYKNHEKSREIITYLKENNIGVSKTRIAEDLHIHINTLSKYLIMLENLRIIYREKIDKNYLYFIETNYELEETFTI